MIMFDGLKVAKNNKMLCEKWMNQCPVIFLSFKDVDGRTFENAFELLKFTIAQRKSNGRPERDFQEIEEWYGIHD